jgi:hypothetical protein
MTETRERYVLLCQQFLVFAVVAAVAAPAAGVVTLDIVSPSRTEADRIDAIRTPGASPEVAGALVASRPVAPIVKQVPLTGVDPVGRRSLGPTLLRAAPERLGGRPAVLGALTRPEAVGGFATVGVSWKHGVTVPEGSIAISVRTLKNGTWTAWESMDYHDDHGPDAGSAEARRARPGTDPFVVGEVDDVQVKAVTPDGSLPADMKLALVDPGATSAPRLERPAIDTAHLTAFESGNPADPGALDDPTDPADPLEPDDPAIMPSAAVDITPQPQIFSRAQWGADERMRDKSSLRYGEVHAAFVHHTVNANDYTKAQVPAILRGIYAYHTQSRGWSDIGYNYLVDRFGRIWEGRYGGVGRPVVGAHTLGFNDWSTAMSAIGNYDIAKPSAAMIDAYARMWAWKLSLHGVSAGSTKQWVGTSYFQAINGHKDDGQKTACPGKYLYAQLPAIRVAAAKYQHSFASRNLRTNISGTTWPDLVVRDRATQTMSVVRTGGQVTYLPAVRIGSGWGGMDQIVSAGDLTGDGYADVVARVKATGVTSVYPGSATGKLSPPVRATTRFKDDDVLVGAGDLDGDGRFDLVGRDAATKKLWLYPGVSGGFGTAELLSSDWSGFNLTTGVGDFDSDGNADLVARDTQGRLFLFPGQQGKLGAARQIGVGFSSMDLIAGRGDVTNDGRPDLIARVAATKLTRVYVGDGTGSIRTSYGPYDRFKHLNWVSGGGQFAGSSARDIIGRNSVGNLVAFPNSGGRNVSQIVKTSVSLAGTNLLLNVGDWNNDGFGDVMTRTTAGQMQLRLGKGNDTFAAPVVAGSGWSGIAQIVSVGDVTGDGNNDLMARVGSTGIFKIYPGNGATAITKGYEAHSAVTSNRQVAVGLYDADGAPDTMITKTDGSLWFYPGNGPGGMTNGRQILTGLKSYDWLLGLGDLDGDGRSDLVGRNSSGVLYLIPGTRTGFGPARYLASGFSIYDLAG